MSLSLRRPFELDPTLNRFGDTFGERFSPFGTPHPEFGREIGRDPNVNAL
jgi:hypothetical protein